MFTIKAMAGIQKAYTCFWDIELSEKKKKHIEKPEHLRDQDLLHYLCSVLPAGSTQ